MKSAQRKFAAWHRAESTKVCYICITTSCDYHKIFAFMSFKVNNIIVTILLYIWYTYVKTN